MLCRASHVKVRLAQRQLGHRSTQTTRVYADVLSADAALGVEDLTQ
jgi:integrase